MKFPHLRCDSHTSFKVKWSTVRVADERGLTVSAKPGSHTACYANVGRKLYKKNIQTQHTEENEPVSGK